jgi:hypothetical protein
VLRENGKFIAAQALESAHTAATVKLVGDKVTVSDGAFAETREQVGGFILIEAKDRAEAIEIASKIPPARLGRVEVRPIKELTYSTVTRKA